MFVDTLAAGDAGSPPYRLQHRGLRDDVDDAFEEANWDRDKEFKGRYLFSSSKGDTSVGIDARIELTQTIVKGTTAAKNARAMFCLAFNYEGRTESNYLALAGRALRRCPKPPNKKGDKCLAAVYYDRTDIAGATAIGDMVEAAALARKLTLVETPTPPASSNNTPDLIVADILAYLKSWDVIHPRSCPDFGGKRKGRILPVSRSTSDRPPARAASGGTRHGRAYREGRTAA